MDITELKTELLGLILLKKRFKELGVLDINRYDIQLDSDTFFKLFEHPTMWSHNVYDGKNYSHYEATLMGERFCATVKDIEEDNDV